MIKTVGELIRTLERYHKDAPVRMIIRQGELEGIDQVRDCAGRIALIPGKENFTK